MNNLKCYLEITKSASEKLWVWPDSLKNCTKDHIAKIICRIIEAGDPGHKPTAHQVRGYAATLAYLRTFDVAEVQESGQWASSQSFITRYLSNQLIDVPCVAMGSNPV